MGCVAELPSQAPGETEPDAAANPRGSNRTTKLGPGWGLFEACATKYEMGCFSHFPVEMSQ